MRSETERERGREMLTYHEITDFSTVACTVCGDFNLETELCFNCKGMLECLECCGCEELEEGEGE